MTVDAHIGFSRFGLGLRPGDPTTDPRGQMLDEISAPDVALLDDGRLFDSPAALAAYLEFRMEKKAGKADAANATADAPSNTDAAMAEELPEPDTMGADMGADIEAMEQPGQKPGKKGKLKPQKNRKAAAAEGDAQNYNLRVELPVRLERIGGATPGFAERLVAFWTNHFAIEADNGAVVRALAGPFEREAIRPHILGSFEDLLFAATRHPAMLVYLNNATSVGPDSKAGQRREAGLNENHARELMELHTLGVDGGYTQADVTSLARILTGWSVGRNKSEDIGKFMFRGQAHEPGAQSLLGQAFDQKGVRQGEAALRLLAGHPATARHIANKLARHFVADTPPPGLVDRLATVFTDTKGDLHAVSTALVEADEAWAVPPTKLRLPQEYLWSAMRALGLTLKPGPAMQALQSLGQPLMNPPSPAGFSDLTTTWLAPDAMTTRLDIAQELATAAGDLDPRDVAEAVLGPLLGMETRQTIERAESPAQGLALMLMSPEFQRR
jgi:uncharacterized protein (DUF1800 family)